jgi:hypothetical protein
MQINFDANKSKKIKIDRYIYLQLFISYKLIKPSKMDVVSENSSGSEIDKKVEIARTIQDFIPKTPPRPIPEPGSLAAWLETPSPVTPKDPTEYSQCKKRGLGQINPRANSNVKSFNGSSTSVFGERAATSNKNKAPAPQARKIEGDILNDYLSEFKIVINSKTKGDIVKEMQLKKLLKSKYEKKPDPADGKMKNIYSSKEFFLIVNYLIQKAKTNGLENFNIGALSDSVREKIVVEENSFHCDYPEEIFYQKLAQFKIDHHLSG